MHLPEKYINPLTDFGFKKLFGTEPNKDLLIDFLNQLLPEKHQITNLAYSQNEHLANSQQERKAIFDLYCESASGEKFIVELQKSKQNFFKDRSVYYATFPIQEQAKKGTWNFKLRPVYTIGILDFCFDEHKDSKEFVHTIKLKDQYNNTFYDKLIFIYIELPKFVKKVTELENKFEKWIYVFRHLAQLDNKPALLKEKVFVKLFEAAKISKFSPIEKQYYIRSLKYYLDLKNVIDTSKEEGIEEGIKKGIAKGRSEGIKEGRKEGMETGRKEGMETGMKKGIVAMNKAVAALKEGKSIVEVVQLTDLDHETITFLAQNL